MAIGMFMPMVVGRMPVLAGALTDHAMIATGPTSGSYTFAGMSFGDPSSDRIMHICIMGFAASNTTLNSVNISGSSANLLTTYPGSQWNPGRHAFLKVPSGTSGTIQINTSGSWSGCAIFVYRVTGAVDLPASSVQVANTSVATSVTGSVSAVKGGLIIASASSQNNSSLSWAGVEGEAEVSMFGGTRIGAGSTISESDGSKLITSSSIGSTFRRLTISQYG